jgi:hypothetical protein
MQQMKEFLLNELRADRKTDREDFMAKLDASQEKAEVGHKELLARLEDDRQATRRELKKMMEEMMDASHKEMVAEIKSEMDVKTMACQKMVERLEEKEPTSLDMKPEATEQREVAVEDATVMAVRGPKKKRRRDRKQAAERRRQKPKNSTREKCES